MWRKAEYLFGKICPMVCIFKIMANKSNSLSEGHLMRSNGTQTEYT